MKAVNLPVLIKGAFGISDEVNFITKSIILFYK
jgi:hypothetical protein